MLPPARVRRAPDTPYFLLLQTYNTGGLRVQVESGGPSHPSREKIHKANSLLPHIITHKMVRVYDVGNSIAPFGVKLEGRYKMYAFGSLLRSSRACFRPLFAQSTIVTSSHFYTLLGPLRTLQPFAESAVHPQRHQPL